jgi:hypothetical protein
VCCCGKYGLDQFDDEASWRIRTSLNNCEFRRPSLSDLARQGRKINRASKVNPAGSVHFLNTKKRWVKCVRSIYFHPGFNILGAFYEDEMVGYLITYLVEGKYHILQANALPDITGEAQPMAGLVYTRINDLIQEKGIVNISLGMSPFNGTSSHTAFVRQMLFKPVPYSQGYILNPLKVLMLKLRIMNLIRVKSVHRVSRKRTKKTVKLYQGYRTVKRHLKAQQQQNSRSKNSRKLKISGGSASASA